MHFYKMPRIINLRETNCQKALHIKLYRSFAIGQANIQKEHETRIFPGIYVVDYVCKNQQSTVYINADATNYLAVVHYPEDTARATYIDYLKQEENRLIAHLLATSSTVVFKS